MANESDYDCPMGDQACPVAEQLLALSQRVDVLSKQLRIDELTGLFNKRHLTVALQTEMERTRRNKQPTSIVMFDLDHFKSINDTYGHPVGDLVLKTVSKAVKDTLRILDIPCRYGGEEFIVILPTTPLLTATHVAERLREAVAAAYIPLDDPSGELTHLNVTASFGVAAYIHTMNEGMESFIGRADKQLYKSKKAGRDRVAFEPLKEGQSARVSAEEKDALYDALKENEEEFEDPSSRSRH